MTDSGAAVRWTIADLEAFPEDSQRYEIVDGELFVSRASHYEHQATCNRCAFALTDWNNRSRLGLVIPAPGVIFSEADAVIPDVVWVSRRRLALLADDAGHLQGAPELIVEVLSPGATNERRDRAAKLKLYSTQGVQEYWILDWRLQTVAVYRRQEAQLRLVVTLGGEDVLTSPLLPGFTVPVGQLFEREDA
jgi:Uma2 family endonuclease